MRDDDAGRFRWCSHDAETDDARSTRIDDDRRGDTEPPRPPSRAGGHGPGAADARGGARRRAEPGQGRRPRPHSPRPPPRGRRQPARAGRVRVPTRGTRSRSGRRRATWRATAAGRGGSPRARCSASGRRWSVSRSPPTRRRRSLNDGVLSVSAESTAWATQLRMVQAQLLAKIAAAVGDGVVTSLKIAGPVAPSWRKGPRITSPAAGRATRTDDACGRLAESRQKAAILRSQAS